MEETKSVASMMDSTSSKIQQLQKAFAELESYRAVTLNLKWKELEEHFHGLEKSLKRRFDELEDQEKVFEDKVVKSREMLQKRESAILAKEQASLNRLQKKRDAAAMDISTSLKKHRKVSFGYMEEPKPVACAVDDEKASDDTTAVSCVEDPEDPSEDDEVNSSPPLGKFCKDMDSEGLHKFISDNRKNLVAMREEIPLALRAAPSPAGLVLRCLADFYSTDRPKFDGKKDSDLLGLRRTSIMLLECLSILLLKDNSLPVADIITEDVKLQAKAIAEDWRPKLSSLEMGSSNGNSLEAHAFLQLLATFGIASDYEDDFISRLVPMVSRRRQAADLCRSLGLASKMTGVIEELISSGRHIDAVNLAFAFGLTKQFAPVPLLNSYLDEARKAASSIKPGSSVSNPQGEVNERELCALKTVIKCVEEHRLEEQFPLDAIRKDVIGLEKAKSEKKQQQQLATTTEVQKPQPKRARANVSGNGHPIPAAPMKTFYPMVNERYQPAYMYERPGYMYPGGMESHGPPLVGAAPYNMPMAPPPGHANFFGNVYHYQAAPPPPHQYLH